MLFAEPTITWGGHLLQQPDPIMMICLIQAPFCVHPKTGKVCVPIDPDAAWEFDPDAVTTVASLLTQVS